ncbi:MAG: hypothetical protein ABWX96_13655 [Propionibacteriaceae bacterium]
MTTTSAVVYTVPAATQAIVRSIHVSNVNSGSMSFYVGISGSSTAAASQFFSGYAIPGYGSLDWTGFLVLNAGETLTASASNSNALNLVVCGIEVT